MAALFDITVGVLLLRRTPRAAAAELIRAARAEIDAGSAISAELWRALRLHAASRRA